MPAFEQARYVLTYMCAQIEYSYVYLLTTKSEQPEKFKEFKTIYENNSNMKIKIERSDNGTEYCNSEFGQFLETNAILLQTSVAGASASNGEI